MAIKINELLFHATALVNIISKTLYAKLKKSELHDCMIPFIENVQKEKICRLSNSWLQGVKCGSGD